MPSKNIINNHIVIHTPAPAAPKPKRKYTRRANKKKLGTIPSVHPYIPNLSNGQVNLSRGANDAYNDTSKPPPPPPSNNLLLDKLSKHLDSHDGKLDYLNNGLHGLIGHLYGNNDQNSKTTNSHVQPIRLPNDANNAALTPSNLQIHNNQVNDDLNSMINTDVYSNLPEYGRHQSLSESSHMQSPLYNYDPDITPARFMPQGHDIPTAFEAPNTDVGENITQALIDTAENDQLIANAQNAYNDDAVYANLMNSDGFDALPPNPYDWTFPPGINLYWSHSNRKMKTGSVNYYTCLKQINASVDHHSDIGYMK